MCSVITTEGFMQLAFIIDSHIHTYESNAMIRRIRVQEEHRITRGNMQELGLEENVLEKVKLHVVLY